MVPTSYYMVLGALVFLLGTLGFLTRRTLIQALMCLELMMSAVSLTFLAVGRSMPDAGLTGMLLVAFAIVVGAAEVGMGLVLIVLYFRRHQDATSEHLDLIGN